MIATSSQTIRKISDITVKIVHCFSLGSQSSRLSDDCCVDIELLQIADNLYHIRVTNYNRGNADLPNKSTTFLISKFSSLIESERLETEKYLRAIHFAVKEEENEIPQIFCLSVDASSFPSCDGKTLDCSIQKKNYLFAGLQCNMLSTNIFMFKSSVMEELDKLNTLDNNLRYIFHSGDEIFWRNKIHVQRAFASCGRVARAVDSVLKNSECQSFRKKCLRNIGSSDISDCGDSVLEKLLSLICQKYHKAEGKSKVD